MRILSNKPFPVGPDDYTSVSSMEFTFRPVTATEPRCRDIQITNEEVLENNESFLVILGSSDNAVLINQDTTNVTIFNDDSKFHCNLFRPVFSFCVSFLGILVRFIEAEYSINENGDTQEVCVALAGRSQVPVSISLVTVDGSAISKLLLLLLLRCCS